MKGEELKAGDPVEAVKRPEGKQTLPPGTRGRVKLVHPEHKGLIWIETDTPVRAMVVEGRGKGVRKEVVGTDFFVDIEEIKKV